MKEGLSVTGKKNFWNFQNGFLKRRHYKLFTSNYMSFYLYKNAKKA